MKQLRRACALLILFALLPVSARADVFRIPQTFTEIETEAFSDISFENGVFIPEEVTFIAPDAFPGANTVYGMSGSAAENYAKTAGVDFVPVEINDPVVNVPGWASPFRPVAAEVSAESPSELLYAFSVEREGEILFAREASSEPVFSFTPAEGGLYSLRVALKNDWYQKELLLEDAIEVGEPIALLRPDWQIAVGDTVFPVDDTELREITLSSSDPEGLFIDGLSVTGRALGAYVVTASTLAEEGVIYTDIPVEVVIPVDSVSVSADENFVYEGETLHLAAHTLPKNATYPEVLWTSSDESVLTVDENGVVTGVSQGKAVVVAIAGEALCEIELSVLRQVESLTVLPEGDAEAFAVGMKMRFFADALPETADDITVRWSSSNESVLTVDEKTGIATGIRAGHAIVRAAANDRGGVTGSYPLSVLPGAETIVISAEKDALTVGETERLSLRIEPQSAADAAVDWASSDPAVARVDESGRVAAVAPGVCVISAQTENGARGELTLLVATPETGIETHLTQLTLNQGMTVDTSAFVFVRPADATFTSLEWSSSNSACASVDAQTGRLTALNPGKAVITGKSHFGLTVSVPVTVISSGTVIHAQSVSPSYSVLTRGQSLKLTASCSSCSAAYKNGVWYTDNPDVVRVVYTANNPTATVTAVGVGSANVYAVSTSGVAGVCEILVNPVAANELSLNASLLTLNVGDAFTLNASTVPANADVEIAWSSSAPEVVSVSKSGVVRALSGGKAVLSASTADGLWASCTVTVAAIPMTEASLVESEMTGNAGETRRIAYTYAPENATPAAFRWTSEDESVASVNESTGEVTFVSAGTTAVHAMALDGSAIMLTQRVTVLETPVRDFVLSADALTLQWGEEAALTWAVYPRGASYASPRFTSDNPSVATVDENGRVLAVSKGETVVRASVGSGDYAVIKEVSVKVTSDNSVSYRALIAGEFSSPSVKGFLPFSVNGTTGVRDALARSSVGGSRYSIRLLSASPTPTSFRAAIRQLASEADSNDVTVIFFLTHGSYNASSGYMMGTSSGTTIYGTDLFSAVKEISGHVALVLCTCHSGRFLSLPAVSALMNAGGHYEGKNGAGTLSVLCSATDTKSCYFDTPDTSASYDFYTYAFTQALGWDMIADGETGALPSDANGDGKITLSELAKYTRTQTQRGISSFIQQNGTSAFNGNANQYPKWRIADGEADLVLFAR